MKHLTNILLVVLIGMAFLLYMGERDASRAYDEYIQKLNESGCFMETNGHEFNITRFGEFNTSFLIEPNSSGSLDFGIPSG